MLTLDTYIGAGIGILSSIISAAITYGAMKEKVARLEAEVKENHEEMDGMVSFRHFEAVIEPIKNTLEAIEKDIKELILLIARKGLDK